MGKRDIADVVFDSVDVDVSIDAPHCNQGESCVDGGFCSKIVV